MLNYVNNYFPDILPESVLKHYGYSSRPEGNIGESALFSRDVDYAEGVLLFLIKSAAKNKGNNDDTANAKALASTSETSVGNVSFNSSISKYSDNVKKFSLDVDRFSNDLRNAQLWQYDGYEHFSKQRNFVNRKAIFFFDTQNKNETVSLNTKDKKSRGYISYDLSRTDNIANNVSNVNNNDTKLSRDVNIDEFDETEYTNVKLSKAEYNKLCSEALT